MGFDRRTILDLSFSEIVIRYGRRLLSALTVAVLPLLLTWQPLIGLKETLKSNGRFIILIGGLMLVILILSGYKMLRVVFYLRKHLWSLDRQSVDAESHLQMLARVAAAQIRVLQKNLAVTWIIIAVLVGVSLYSYGDLQKATARLASTQIQLDSTHQELGAARQRLEEVTARLTLTQTQLDSIRQHFAIVPTPPAARQNQPDQKKVSITMGELDSNRKVHLLVLAGKLDEARSSYLDLFHKDSKDAAVINNLGNVNLMLGFVDSAFYCYDRAITADPADTAIFFNLAVALDLLATAKEGSEKRLFESKTDSAFDILVKSKKALATVERLLGEVPSVPAVGPDNQKILYGHRGRIQKKLSEAKQRKSARIGKATKTPTRPAGTKHIQPPKNTIYVYWKFR